MRCYNVPCPNCNENQSFQNNLLINKIEKMLDTKSQSTVKQEINIQCDISKNSGMSFTEDGTLTYD